MAAPKRFAWSVMNKPWCKPLLFALFLGCALLTIRVYRSQSLTLTNRHDVSLSTNSHGQLVQRSTQLLDPNTKARFYRPRFYNVDDILAFQVRAQNLRHTNHDISLLKVDRQRHMVNCSNVGELKLTRLLRTTVHKATYDAVYRGVRVVAVSYKIRNMNMCIKKTMEILESGTIDEIQAVLFFTRCSFMPGDSFIYEILNHAILDYPNIIKMLGYCVRDYMYIGDDRSIEDILEHTTIAVFEYGEPMCVSSLSTLTWLDRVRHSRDLANFLSLLESSLLGPISLTDMREKHFVMVGNQIKFKDLDLFVTSVEPKCGALELISQSENAKIRRIDNYNFNCSYNVNCSNGVCLGANSRENLFTFNEFFFKVLLDIHTAPKRYFDKMTQFFKDMDEFKLKPLEIKAMLEFLLVDGKEDEESLLDYPVYFVI